MSPHASFIASRSTGPESDQGSIEVPDSFMSAHIAVAWTCGALIQGLLEDVGCMVTISGIVPSEPDALTSAFLAWRTIAFVPSLPHLMTDSLSLGERVSWIRTTTGLSATSESALMSLWTLMALRSAFIPWHLRHQGEPHPRGVK